MLKKHIAACLVGSALVAVPAIAQTSGSGSAASGSSTAQSGAASGGAAGTTASGAGGNVAYMTRREPGVMRASDLIGTDVYSAANEDMGEVDDVLINRSGQVVGLVLGIGGFLGLGETKVAVPMNAVQLRPRDAVRSGAGTAGTTGGAAGTAGTTGTAGTGAAGTAGTGAAGTGAAGGTAGTGAAGTAGTGAAGTGAAGGTAGTRAGATGADRPDVIVLMVTRDQLRSAPKFEDDARQGTGAAGTRGGTGTGAGTGTAPRQ